ncbi:hypothetical protein [Methylobacterium durans]|uniref:Uncharacterized protein n=1 Tax=Methylobacterium durans TaxID=2202825 RepID=A0A2U8WBB1_9HYPH|nr:hypothetical protein [Methylobacterium durans]AWN42582.1 hypothetical protein DK389_21345 [Methylobacterium durans]
MTRPSPGRRAACPADPARPCPSAAAALRRAPPMLRLWRVVPPQALGPATARSLLMVLRVVEPPCSRRRWEAALRGDPAAMARVALTVLRVHGVTGPAADTAASGLLVQALRGDRTAPVILATALRRLARRRPDDRHLAVLADRWAAWSPRVPPAQRARPAGHGSGP